MQPEDIDKLFRDQLQHHAPTPPAYLWEQLEADLQPARRRPAMWLYAAAAMIALLIVAGGTWLLRTSDSGATTGTLATATTGQAASETAASQAVAAAKKSSTRQATAINEVSSSRLEGPTSAAQVAATAPAAAAAANRVSRQPTATATVARAVARQASLPATTRAAQALPATTAPSQAVAAASSPATAHPERLAGSAVAALAPSSVSPALTGAIEVEVHRGTETPVALAAADAPQSYESDSHLKNLFHKAKTAVQDGRVKLPRVELPETVTVQVNVFNHSATKVIQL